MGINVFILQYTTDDIQTAKKAREDLGTAIEYIIDNRKVFDVSEDYAVFGFSAGGHLTAELGTSNIGYMQDSIPKPSALILGYPVIDLEQCEEDTKKLMLDAMIHPEWTKGELEQYQILNYVDENYPDTYIWHAVNDDTVMYEGNCLPLYRLLTEKGVRCKMRTVGQGAHGIGIGSGTEAEGWLEEAADFWLKR